MCQELIALSFLISISSFSSFFLNTIFVHVFLKEQERICEFGHYIVCIVFTFIDTNGLYNNQTKSLIIATIAMYRKQRSKQIGYKTYYELPKSDLVNRSMCWWWRSNFLGSQDLWESWSDWFDSLTRPFNWWVSMEKSSAYHIGT